MAPPDSPDSSEVVIPAKAGIHLLPTNFLQSPQHEIDNMDSRFRGNDESDESGESGGAIHHADYSSSDLMTSIFSTCMSRME